MICKKCFIDKEQNQYETYFHSRSQKLFTRRICRVCFREQQKIQKRMVRRLKKLQPEVLELQPDPYLNHPDYKICRSCNKWMHKLEDFYSNRSGHIFPDCKVCIRAIDLIKRSNTKKEHLIQNCGSDNTKLYPNEYTDEYQKDYIFSVLKKFGWSHSKGIWWKAGFKTKDGVWLKYNNKPIKGKKKSIY